jgi:hypothetical protein
LVETRIALGISQSPLREPISDLEGGASLRQYSKEDSIDDRKP